MSPISSSPFLLFRPSTQLHLFISVYLYNSLHGSRKRVADSVSFLRRFKHDFFLPDFFLSSCLSPDVSLRLSSPLLLLLLQRDSVLIESIGELMGTRPMPETRGISLLLVKKLLQRTPIRPGPDFQTRRLLLLLLVLELLDSLLLYLSRCVFASRPAAITGGLAFFAFPSFPRVEWSLFFLSLFLRASFRCLSARLLQESQVESLSRCIAI